MKNLKKFLLKRKWHTFPPHALLFHCRKGWILFIRYTFLFSCFLLIFSTFAYISLCWVIFLRFFFLSAYLVKTQKKILSFHFPVKWWLMFGKMKRKKTEKSNFAWKVNFLVKLFAMYLDSHLKLIIHSFVNHFMSHTTET